MIKGYKGFKKGLVDRNDNKYEVGMIYSCEDDVIFDRSGFHIYENIEDALMFSEASKNEESVICEVSGYGKIDENKNNRDTIYGNMYAVENMVIERILDRNEILTDMYSVDELRMLRYLLALKLNENEIKSLENRFKNNLSMLDHIAYYQKDDKDVYKRRIKRYEKNNR